MYFDCWRDHRKKEVLMSSMKLFYMSFKKDKIISISVQEGAIFVNKK